MRPLLAVSFLALLGGCAHAFTCDQVRHAVATMSPATLQALAGTVSEEERLAAARCLQPPRRPAPVRHVKLPLPTPRPVPAVPVPDTTKPWDVIPKTNDQTEPIKENPMIEKIHDFFVTLGIGGIIGLIALIYFIVRDGWPKVKAWFVRIAGYVKTEEQKIVATFKSDVTAVKADVAVLKTDVATHKADIAAVKAKVGL